ncbi:MULTISPECIES: ATP-binding cassette domain-containing protein [Methanoculleus]|jgi:cobalt/nickel transport system ATP-binding protein|uniref:ABC transporter ATP-binding protein n=1 Tax=Methanoculleus thermophilus TaxID=2200 RepID=A0A1G9BPW1_9EURY|nr:MULTISPECIES: ATP-binding cassette domain-containing protein [Methanoculleus]NLN08711.1 ATP-binding cassette domain-containing protein [Methanoculleus thermophilus]SDK41453.1 cobalt/nickel transport system ATP-binding protein [Methanoculleus thermophilus]HQD25374.1 ATP-binding cassette domain-containing protein [Methanoculleus thermophilus]
MHLIETRDLTHIYHGGVRALESVNFIAERKSRIAVIGPNGAGKSTLFKHFNGILKPTSGEVLVRGEPITKENLREVRKFVGIVFQNPDDQIFSPTVEQDVAFGPTNLGLDETTVAHRVEEALHLLGIEELRDRVPHHLSGGEKKRVAIAGILAMEPQVLVLDEPTAGLDPQGVSDLVEFINRLPNEYGMTVVFSTHHLDLVAEMADFVYVMDKGSVVGSGTVEEIFARSELLARTRLNIPPIPKLIRSLQENGIPIEMAYTYEDAKKSFLEAYARRV